MADRVAGTPVLAAEGVGREFRVRSASGRVSRARVLEDVSLTLHAGEIVALVGESGSGKSTLAKILGFALEPSSGEVRLDGVRAPRRVTRAMLRRVQLVFQDPFGSLNRLQRLRYLLGRPLRLHGHARSSAEVAAGVRALLESVNLTPAESYIDRHPDDLSGGQRQRVVIARALAPRPDVILADEPVSMLDVSIRREVLDLLRGLRDEHGVAMLYVTHDIASARHIADTVAVMYGGRIVERGPVEEVLASPRHPYTRVLIEATPDPAPPGERRRSRPAPLSGAPGEPPSLVDPPPGCRFQARCPLATDVCRTEAPPRVAAGGREAECWNPLGSAAPESVGLRPPAGERTPRP